MNKSQLIDILLDDIEELESYLHNQDDLNEKMILIRSRINKNMNDLTDLIQ